jgi:hypothetical protein
VGLVRDEGGVRGVAGEVVEERGDRWRLLLPVPRGAPILDERNDVVAVATASHGAGAIDAVPVARLRALAASRTLCSRAPS